MKVSPQVVSTNKMGKMNGIGWFYVGVESCDLCATSRFLLFDQVGAFAANALLLIAQ